MTVEATDEEAAEAIGDKMTDSTVYSAECRPLYRVGDALDFDEHQIDNTPWEIEVE